MSLVDKVFYRKVALTKGDKVLNIYKFKTMYPNSDLKWRELALEGALDEFGKVQNDMRITPFGKFLRKYWIDELPQIYNILCGDIGLVGIRPRSKDFWDLKNETHKERCLMYKPGFLGVNYFYHKYPGKLENNKQKTEAVERLYLKNKRNNPVKTDLIFLSKIMYNIAIKDLRSS